MFDEFWMWDEGTNKYYHCVENKDNGVFYFDGTIGFGD